MIDHHMNDQLATVGILLLLTAALGAIGSLLWWVKGQYHKAHVRWVTADARLERRRRAVRRLGLGRGAR